MTESKSQIIAKLKELLADKVEFALIFGSILKEHFNEESDIDVAVYLKQPPVNWRERLELQVELSTHFSQELDLVILNSSDIIITMQVLANGELLINNDPHKFIRFKAQKLSEYPDFKMSRKIIEDNMLRGGINA